MVLRMLLSEALVAASLVCKMLQQELAAAFIPHAACLTAERRCHAVSHKSCVRGRSHSSRTLLGVPCKAYGLWPEFPKWSEDLVKGALAALASQAAWMSVATDMSGSGIIESVLGITHRLRRL